MKIMCLSLNKKIDFYFISNANKHIKIFHDTEYLNKPLVYSGFNKNVTQKKPRPNNGQCGRPSRPVCGSEPADLGDLAGRLKRTKRPT
ncbi:hypothetical protein BpHYR1_013598 [Brachionus plicatilis]|uniref:Uncharacterized protein n=1 Tax=Brachionus plicatilis TaxID=10195 RepID=A0A3M7QZZ4_BRAPC|nr:hypothetical protein BpHYR1_013598 [Brachionus plicatilis]